VTHSIVTGAAGFAGSTLADRLLALGHDVTGIDCFTDYYSRAEKESNVAAARAHERFTLTEDDLATADLRSLLDGADVVFHIAGQAGVRPSWGEHFDSYVRHNITATQRLLEAAKESNIRRFVFASSSSVYGNADELPVTERALPRPVSPYGVTKLAAEHLCSLYATVYGAPCISLRLFTVYGPRQRPDMAIRRFLEAARDGSPIAVYGDGDQTRDFTFVGDVVDALLLASEAETPERVLNICGGSRISLADLIALIEDVTGRTLRIEHQEAARGDARDTWGDSSLAREAIGYAPKVSLREGVEAAWAWLQERA
jgi:nucleoside-diphosphate-sugar epimerase